MTIEQFVAAEGIADGAGAAGFIITYDERGFSASFFPLSGRTMSGEGGGSPL